MELLELPAMESKFNISVTSHPPVFYVQGVDSATSYKVKLYAVNAKGLSDPVYLETSSFKGAAKYTGIPNKDNYSSNSTKNISFQNRNPLENRCNEILKVSSFLSVLQIICPEDYNIINVHTRICPTFSKIIQITFFFHLKNEDRLSFISDDGK